MAFHHHLVNKSPIWAKKKFWHIVFRQNKVVIGMSVSVTAGRQTSNLSRSEKKDVILKYLKCCMEVMSLWALSLHSVQLFAFTVYYLGVWASCAQSVFCLMIKNQINICSASSYHFSSYSWISYAFYDTSTKDTYSSFNNFKITHKYI